MRVFKRAGRERRNRFAFFVILLLLFGLISMKTDSFMLSNDSIVPSRDKTLYRVRREPADSLDVIIVGDSLTYSSVSPLQLWKEHGFTSYVCGQWGQKIIETEDMLKTALHRQKPRVVILETDVLFRTQMDARHLNDGIETGLKYYMPVFRGHDIWKSLVIKKEYKLENYKGFVFRTDVKPYEKGDYMKKNTKEVKLEDTILSHMENIINLCEKSGAELILLGTPSPINYNYARSKAVSEYAREKSLVWLDMNYLLKEIGINWKTDSLDQGDHLNFSGAEKVTKYLGKYLAEKYKLPDHREDSAYASWAKESLVYEEEAAKVLNKLRGDKK